MTPASAFFTSSTFAGAAAGVGAAPNEKDGTATTGAATSFFSARTAPKKLGFAAPSEEAVVLEGGVEVARGVANEKPPAAGLAAAVEDVEGAEKEKAGGLVEVESSFFSFEAGAANENEGTEGLGASLVSFFAVEKENEGVVLGAAVVGAGAPILLRSEDDSFFFSSAPSFFSAIVAVVAAGAPKLNPAGTLNCIPLSTESSRGGRSSSRAEKTFDEAVCVLEEWDLPGRREERPVGRVEAVVEGKEEGVGKEIFGIAGTGGTADAAVGGGGEGERAEVGDIGASSASEEVARDLPFDFLVAGGAGEGDLEAPARVEVRVERRAPPEGVGGSRVAFDDLVPLALLEVGLLFAADRVTLLGETISSSMSSSWKLLASSSSSSDPSSLICLLLLSRFPALTLSRSRSSFSSRSRSSRSCSRRALRRASRARRTA